MMKLGVWSGSAVVAAALIALALLGMLHTGLQQVLATAGVFVFVILGNRFKIFSD
jgi:hypothetical protein